ncbi:MAG: methylisocitrate lyase [Pseudomonadota bacterium]|nr:methylisocitrate lyase [Pseudomonadota bacterium]
MLFTTNTSKDKRNDFKKAIMSGNLLMMPGAHSPIVARIVEELNFDGIYISGAAISAELALPDIGLTTLSEVAYRGRQIARVTDLPSIIDADTGFGEALNTARTIQEFEELGLAGCHIEDQISNKRCGHLDNKVLVDSDVMTQKIRAAVQSRKDPNFMIIARTDAKGVEGLDAAVRRGLAYQDAGADIIFPEALETPEEYKAFRGAIDVPLVANMTEFGRTPLYDKKTLESLGYNIAIYPVTSLRLSNKAIKSGYQMLKNEESNAKLLDAMQTRNQLYELLNYQNYNTFDRKIYNFKS